MNEYPKLIEDVEERYRPLFRALYAHERARLGMIPEIDCPFCTVSQDKTRTRPVERVL
jgi:hypothetical protein